MKIALLIYHIASSFVLLTAAANISTSNDTFLPPSAFLPPAPVAATATRPSPFPVLQLPAFQQPIAFNNPDYVTEVEQAFLKWCPPATSKNLPTEAAVKSGYSRPLRVSVSLKMLKLVIRDPEELSIRANLGFKWKLPCSVLTSCEQMGLLAPSNPACNSNLLPKAIRELNFRFFAPPTAWKPQLSGLSDYAISFPVFINPFHPEGPVATWNFPSHLLHLSCASPGESIKRFPFDEMACKLEMTPNEHRVHLELSVDNTSFSPTFSSDFLSSSWQILPQTYQNASSPAVVLVRTVWFDNNENPTNISQLLLAMKFQRKYTFYMSSVSVPTYVTILLLLAALAMPPRLADRATFCMIAMLAFSVLLVLIFQLVPQGGSSGDQIPYFVAMVVIKYLCGLAITVYTLIAVPLASSASLNNKRYIGRWRFSMLRLTDATVAIVVLLIIIISDFVHFRYIL